VQLPNMRVGLTRISHHPSAASAYLTPSQGLPLHGVLDSPYGGPSMSASPALREALDLIRRTANTLATEAGEKSGLTYRASTLGLGTLGRSRALNWRSPHRSTRCEASHRDPGSSGDDGFFARPSSGRLRA